MSTSLPPLRPPHSAESSRSLELPFKPLVTKAQKYTELVKFDRLRLKRQEAHFRNALKTTTGLVAVATDLQKVSNNKQIAILQLAQISLKQWPHFP